MSWFSIKDKKACLKEVWVPEKQTEKTALLANTEPVVIFKARNQQQFNTLYDALVAYMEIPSSNVSDALEIDINEEQCSCTLRNIDIYTIQNVINFFETNKVIGSSDCKELLNKLQISPINQDSQPVDFPTNPPRLIKV